MLEEAHQLVEQESHQLYSEAAGKFLADRFVTGTCPKCGYEVGFVPHKFDHNGILLWLQHFADGVKVAHGKKVLKYFVDVEAYPFSSRLERFERFV